MKATVEELNSVQRRVNITIPGEVVTKAFNKVYAQLQKKADLKGFRRGKAPLTVIKRLYSSQAARDVADNLVDSYLYSAINDHKIKLIAAPVIELSTLPALDSEYTFAAVVDLMPEVVLNNCYKGLEIPCKEYRYDDATLEREFKALARRFATTSELHPHTPAAVGHLATISHLGSVDGQEHSGLKVNSADVALGQQEVLPVLEAAIIGMKAGEEKDLDFTLPVDHTDPSLAGKAVTLHLVVEQLKELSIPAIDDQLAKDMQCADLNELRKKVQEQLTAHVNQQTDRSKREELFKALGTMVDFEVPPVLVDQTIDSMIQDFSFLKDDDKKKAKKDASVRKSLAPEAKIKVKNTLILWQIGKDEGLSVSDDEVRAELQKRYRELAGVSATQLDTAMEKIGAQTREGMLLEKAMQCALDLTIFAPTHVTV
jgi:trigger factor